MDNLSPKFKHGILHEFEMKFIIHIVKLFFYIFHFNNSKSIIRRKIVIFLEDYNLCEFYKHFKSHFKILTKILLIKK